MPNTYASVKNRAAGPGRLGVKKTDDPKKLKAVWVKEVQTLFMELTGHTVTGLDRLTIDTLKQMHEALS